MGDDTTPRGPKGFGSSIRRRGNDDADSALTNPWIAAGAVLLLLLIPLLPFLAIVWMVSRTLRGVRERVSWE
ncbi:MAG: hypothetical protein ACI8UR_000920 [Natronomonas sp.]|jgi:hypothetical protein|uniref:DUF7535 family protein n=1 Tax=Natronomonas sp. TaxID=2184060 RepID=UPI0039E72504